MIEISDIEKLVENGFDIRLSQDMCSLPQNETKKVSMSIGIEKWAPSGMHTIEIRVISAQAEGLGEVFTIRDEDLVIRVKGPFNPYVFYPVSILSIVILLSANSVFIILLIDRKLKKRYRKLRKAEE